MQPQHTMQVRECDLSIKSSMAGVVYLNRCSHMYEDGVARHAGSAYVCACRKHTCVGDSAAKSVRLAVCQLLQLCQLAHDRFKASLQQTAQRCHSYLYRQCSTRSALCSAPSNKTQQCHRSSPCIAADLLQHTLTPHYNPRSQPGFKLSA
jgi:hypothetical protein